MKRKPSKEEMALKRPELRAIERELGVFLDKPETVQRTTNQQFGVYDEDDKYVGDITSECEYFSVVELTSKIKELF